nr:glycosyl hydrolase family 32 [Galbitalea soli]
MPDSWVWDFWIADTGEEYHLFFLFASRALQEESARHRRASIGHAVSTDLVNWTRVADALVRSDAPAADDVATWTGCTVRGDDGFWYMFYTGTNDDPVPSTQRVMVAVSRDLMTWRKQRTPVAVADPRWYSTGADGGDEAFRDPWVFREGGLWHMFTTARARTGSVTESGVVGHATSSDLLHWDVQPPVTPGNEGFGQLEVTQLVEVEERPYLLFNCLRTEIAPRRRDVAGTGGIWIAAGESPLGPFDIDGAVRLTDNRYYVGRVITDRAGVQQFLAFENVRDGEFIGRIADPVPFAGVLAAAGVATRA